MASKTKQTREKPRSDFQKRQLRKSQLLFGIFSTILILSMIISLVRW